MKILTLILLFNAALYLGIDALDIEINVKIVVPIVFVRKREEIKIKR